MLPKRLAIRCLAVWFSLVTAWGGADSAAAQAFPADKMETLLERYDDNKNGKLDGDEVKAAKRYLKRMERRQKRLAAAKKRNANRPRGRRGRFGGRTDGKTLSPKELEPREGAPEIHDRATFQKLSYKGSEVMRDTHLAGIEFVKFQIADADSKEPKFYFINTNTYRAHPMFMAAVGLERGERGTMRGVLCYYAMLKSPSGNPGLYTFEFEPNDSFSHGMIKIAYDLLIDRMPALKDDLSFYPIGRALPKYEEEKALYKKSGIPIFLEKDADGDIGYLPLNPARSFGRLRLMRHDERPAPRDIVLYQTLPNELSRVAGIITAVRQTPLSHVNLRAVQDKVPNAFIVGAAESPEIKSLLGKYVYYNVTVDGYEIREAKASEVEAYFGSIRPPKAQAPKRDLSVTEIRRLSDVGFEDAASVGVKAANVAVLKTFGFDQGTVPDGAAIPFHYYDAFMKHNGFYAKAKKMIATPAFRRGGDAQVAALAAFRAAIERGSMPPRMMEALTKLHRSFPAGTRLRCRSSTNNEDLPGFSGAGLYDSCTHRAGEGHLSKSIRQVYASLWNYRAFEEREFYRVNHFTTAMGVLVHSNFERERVNGVAVTDDILYQTKGNYYINVQIGEDMVTNPESESVPEEVLLDWWETKYAKLMRSSNRVAEGKRILDEKQLEELRKNLAIVHKRFRALYGKSKEDRFAMEIEFKVTSAGKLVIKQARPWVYPPQPKPAQPTKATDEKTKTATPRR